MDLPLERMYDSFKDDIWRELGPLDPDWFDVLTAQAVTTEGNVSDQEDLCANQEGNFKIPFAAAESQLFSTPKVFRHSRVVSPETEDEKSFTAEPGADSQEAGQNPESHNSSSHSSLNQSDDIWRQKLPDAIEDGEIRSTVASVLDGAENVLSIFFSNNSSALRKVKTERVKRKKIVSEKEHGCSSAHISTNNMAPSSEKRTADQQPNRGPLSPHLKSPVKTGDVGTTQWSPLSLSEIPSSTVDTSCHNNNPAAQAENSRLTEPVQSDSDAIKLARPSLKISDSGFIKKKRQFVYTVTSKPQVQEKDTRSSKIDSSPVQELNVKHLPNAKDEAECCNINNKTFDGKNEMQQQENITEETQPPSVQAKVQDVDMSQLCRAFAQDFSQMSPPVKLIEAAEDTPQNGFSPSACLSALKRAKHKARQASLHHDCDDVGNRRHVSAIKQNDSINEGTICDSGFQSAVANVSRMTVFSSLPGSEIEGQTQQWTTPFQSTNKENRKSNLKNILHETDETETDAKTSFVVKENRSLDHGGESEVQTKTTSTSSRAKGAVDNINCIPLNDKVHGNLLKKEIVSLPSVHASGFKTASNKGIRISSVNLERAKRLFEETEGERISDQPTKCGHDAKDETTMSHGSVKPSSSEKIRDINFQLTASQKADVTELCTLLEEADSQFDFTQKTATLNQQCEANTTSPQKADKELDPDFLAGIDFDDSFSSDAEKHVTLTVIPDKMTSSGGMKKENFSSGSVTSSSKHIAEGSSSVLSSENLDGEQNEISINPLTLGVGFKTAGGNVLEVSKKCLSKARALFADLEETNSSDKQNGENYARTEHTDNFLHDKEDNSKFGKVIFMAEKAMQDSNSVFRDCDVVDSNDRKHEENIETLPVSVIQKKNLLKFKSIHGKLNVSKEPVRRHAEFVNVNSESSVHHTEVQQYDVNIHDNTPALTKSPSFHGNQSSAAKPFSSPLCTSSKNIGSSAIEDLRDAGGFCTASGKKVSVSANAMRKAECLLNEVQRHEDADQQTEQKDNSSRTGHLTSQCGFQTAGGKGVAISSAALEKAKSLLRECVGVEDEASVNPKHSQIPVHDPPPRNSGFLAASGKPVAFSSEALQKAKALFDDITFSSEMPAVSGTRKKQENAPHKEKIHCGFSTAGGAKVHCDVKDGNDMIVEQKSSERVNKQKILPRFKTVGREKVNISEEPVSGCTESENVEAGPEVHHEKMLHNTDVEIHIGGFKNPLGLTNAPFLHSNQPLSSPSCTTAKKLASSAVDQLSNGGGFCTAGGKKVSVSDDAMRNAKSLLNESITFEDLNKQVKQKEDTLQNGGFQTASGKGVAISSAALKKAKSLLSECDDTADKSSAKPTHFKMPFPRSPFRNGGFLAASGKPVAFSSEALQKAKSLFDDISLTSADIPAVSDTWKSDKKQNDAQNNKDKMHCGFTTAGGAKVQVSQKNLLKAKNLLREFDNDSALLGGGGECPGSSSYSTRPFDAHKSDISPDVKRTSNCNLAITSDKDMPAEESAPQVVKSHLSSRETDSENKPDKTSSSEKLEFTKTESSALNFQSLILSGCTETQQKFLAQEALDCTKALLEDESLSMTFENVPPQDNPKSSNRSVKEQKATGKRLVDDADITGQPPLKRRLLDEFDRTLNRSTGSTLQPEKSCPTGVMKDRRVFKYNASLHPNITSPRRDGKKYMETRLQKTTQHSGDGRSAHSKTPTFVPPFFKNSKTETHKDNMAKASRRTHPTFVPPFKKQRTIVQESSTEPHAEEDKHHYLSAVPSNTSTYVPPTKNTSRQSTADVTSNNKSRENIKTVALADNTKISVCCGTEDSAEEASAVVDTLSRSQEMQTLQNIELARDMQDMRIRKKKRQTIRPLPGSLFLTKTSGVTKIPLKDAVNGKPPTSYTQKQLYLYGVHQHVSEITSETAQFFRFSLQQFLKQEAFVDNGGVRLADGGWLIPSKNGTAGKEEFYRALCDTPGVDPKLISEEWVYNHYRWIVWKQASMERCFPGTLGSLCLTPEQVLLQLKYRYDVEVDHSRRPALRKIMEKDDTATKTLVLCVCGVVSRGRSPTRQSHNDAKTPQGADAKAENPCAVVWLTDGWYSIKAQLDDPLTAMLHKGRLAVGGKLIIHGAQLVGSQDACSPLEAPESLMLKICANSSRPARWDTKLGFYRDPRPFLLPLSCLYSNGGPVGCVDMIILRSYPIQWMERKPDGGVVFRSVRAEEKEARRYNSHKQKAMETVFAKIQAEFEKEEKGSKPQRRRRIVSRQDIASLQDGEELYEAVGDDPAYLEADLSEQQMETLRSYRRSLMEKKQAELQDRYRRALENAEDNEGSCPKRDVTPVWRLCIADSMNQSSNVYQLNMWRPSSDLQSLLKEGCRYKVYNLTTSDGKKRSGIETVQLTGTKKTQFQDIQASQEWLSARFQPRVSATFVDLQNPEFQPLCGEVDLTGYVITIIDGQGPSPIFYVVDGKLNFVKVRCFSSLAQSGLEDVLKPRVLLALSNLQLRGQSVFPTPVVYAGDLTVFSTNPKEAHLQESLSQLKNLVQGQENFFLTAEEKLSYLVKSVGMSSISSPALQPRTPAALQQTATDRRQDTKTNVTSQQSIRGLGSFTPVSRNPPPGNGSTEKDPKSLKRRRALDYLSRIPSPPPVSHLSSVASPCVNKTFNPPRRSGTPSTLKTVQTPAHKPVISPVEDEWVNDEELAMIDTQALHVGGLL
ncbi:hypothetical protein PAMA_020266 [Pampus argenteus]